MIGFVAGSIFGILFGRKNKKKADKLSVSAAKVAKKGIEISTKIKS